MAKQKGDKTTIGISLGDINKILTENAIIPVSVKWAVLIGLAEKKVGERVDLTETSDSVEGVEVIE